MLREIFKSADFTAIAILMFASYGFIVAVLTIATIVLSHITGTPISSVYPFSTQASGVIVPNIGGY